MDKLEINLMGCASCGKNHQYMEFRKFLNPFYGGAEWTHWSFCPFTGEPVLLKIEEDKERSNPNT